MGKKTRQATRGTEAADLRMNCKQMQIPEFS